MPPHSAEKTFHRLPPPDSLRAKIPRSAPFNPTHILVRDDNDQTGRLGYQDAEETTTPRGGSRDDDGGVTVGHVDSGLPQAKPGGSIWGRERGYRGDKYQGEHGAGVPYSPLATIQAGVARVEGRPGNRPYGDGGEGLTGSDDGPALTKISHGDCWQWQRCRPRQEHTRTGYRRAS